MVFLKKSIFISSPKLHSTDFGTAEDPNFPAEDPNFPAEDPNFPANVNIYIIL